MIERMRRKIRAAVQKVIPYTKDAFKTMVNVMPELNAKIDRNAIRIPIVTESLVELYTVLDRDITVKEMIAAMKADANDSFVYLADEAISSAVRGFPTGSLINATQTKLMMADGGQLIKKLLGIITSMVSCQTWCIC